MSYENGEHNFFITNRVLNNFALGCVLEEKQCFLTENFFLNCTNIF